MEEVEWKRDETPYIIFACKKCKQFMYAKQTQKTKKCLRCGRKHSVLNILHSGELVNGMTTAVETVKEKQHELAIQELGTAPGFNAFVGFKLLNSPSINRKTVEPSIVENDYLPQFKKMLAELSDFYTKVPYYVFDIFADTYNIPKEELKILIQAFQRKGVIIKTKDRQEYVYTIKLN